MFHLTIVTAEKKLYEGDIRSLVAPAVDGEIGVLTGHHPLVTKLGPGAMRVTRADGSEETLFVNGGFLDVNNNKAVILADAAENLAALSLEEAKTARARAQENLKNAKDEVEYDKLEQELRVQMMKERLANVAEYSKKK